VLPAAHRLTDSAAFSDTVRNGRRAGSRALVVHLRVHEGSSAPVALGLTVSKAVGNAVVRTRVKRRLRHQAADLLDMLPTGSTVVVRALPPAADATSVELGAELRTGLARCLERTREMTIR
jgi:ribonuclease P protein component